MNLLFIENRYATRLYEILAPAVQAAGHRVHWMVQNPSFAPRAPGSSVHPLRFPRRRDLRPADDDPAYARIARSDRAVKYFGRDCRHYAHYHNQIRALLDRTQPDVVFGESTQLHELLAIEECRRRGIRYLFPTSTRYPPARLCFLREDGMEPVGGCGEPMPEADALAMIERINQRSLVPSYMSAPARQTLAQRRRALADKLRISWAWARGERYLTPSPWTKLRVDRMHRRARARWAELAAARPLAEAPSAYVLYPLQMQPESTIDVWGFPWNDQAQIVHDAALALAGLGMGLLVKPNPKPKYEIDDRLCDAVAAVANAIAVPEGVPMSTLFGPASAVLSVTGTVLIESVLAGKPAFTLGGHAMSRYPGVSTLASPRDLAGQCFDAPPSHPRAGVDLLRSLWASSYPVRWIDPFNQPERLSTSYGAALAAAFLDTLAGIQPSR